MMGGNFLSKMYSRDLLDFTTIMILIDGLNQKNIENIARRMTSLNLFIFRN